MKSFPARPLTDRTWLRPESARVRSPFDSTWTATLKQLGTELDRLQGTDLVIGLDVQERELRLDGGLRANAQPETPAVELAFTSRHGPMLYRCDRYTANYRRREGWHENVRAIVKTLEALRAVDRYGATDSGEQYRGYRQLEAKPAASPLGTRARLAQIAGAGPDHPDLVRRALRAAHPDTGGSAELWAEVVELRDVVEGGR